MHLTSTQNFKPFKKIISLVPSQTELLYHLGLDDAVIGITKFCVHPRKWYQTKKRIGGTKTLNIKLIQQLHPDLIIANKEENEKLQVETLIKDFDVWITDVNNLENALSMISAIGHLTDRISAATELINKIKNEFSLIPIRDKITAAYLIWKDPFMTIGGDTFINDMMDRCGLRNVFVEKKRYPIITLDELKVSESQVILLSSEPYPFRQKHINELKTYLPGKKILLADGEMFSWYGSRLIKSPAYFKKLLNNINS